MLRFRFSIVNAVVATQNTEGATAPANWERRGNPSYYELFMFIVVKAFDYRKKNRIHEEQSFSFLYTVNLIFL